MDLNHQSVKAKVHCSLRNIKHKLASACYVARVANQLGLRHQSSELYCHLPQRTVAINSVVGKTKAPVNGTNVATAAAIKSFDCSYPQLDIGIEGIFYKDWYISTRQGIGNVLNRER